MVQEVTPDEGHGRFLLVRTGNLSCALPASDVLRVVRRLRCHAVPGSRSRLVGLAQYGGDPLPVLDLQVLVEHGVSNTRHHSTVILGRRKRGHTVLGLAVDEVIRVVNLPLRDVVADSDTDFVGETVHFEGEEVKVLNTQQLLHEERADKGR